MPAMNHVNSAVSGRRWEATAAGQDDLPTLEAIEECLREAACGRCPAENAPLCRRCAPGFLLQAQAVYALLESGRCGVTGTIGQIADIIGIDAAVRLCQAVGGVSWYIPHKAGTDHSFVKIIGQEAWSALCAAYGGTRLNLPQGDAQIKRQQAKELLEAGKLSVRQIALQTGLTERTISRLRGQNRDNHQQLLPFIRSTSPPH